MYHMPDTVLGVTHTKKEITSSYRAFILVRKIALTSKNIRKSQILKRFTKKVKQCMLGWSGKTSLRRQ